MFIWWASLAHSTSQDGAQLCSVLKCIAFDQVSCIDLPPTVGWWHKGAGVMEKPKPLCSSSSSKGNPGSLAWGPGTSLALLAQSSGPSAKWFLIPIGTELPREWVGDMVLLWMNQSDEKHVLTCKHLPRRDTACFRNALWDQPWTTWESYTRDPFLGAHCLKCGALTPWAQQYANKRPVALAPSKGTWYTSNVPERVNSFVLFTKPAMWLQR